MEKSTLLPLKLILPDPDQPRQEYNPGELKRLQQSIKSQGIMVPLAVEKMAGKNTYLLVDGERRFRSATALGLTEVPVFIYDAMDDKERVMTRFHLQEQHSGWTAFEKARAIATLQDSTGMTALEVADLLGMNPQTIRDYMLLLTLSKRTIKAASDKKIPFAYMAEIGAAKKKIEEVTLRDQVEKELIDRVVSGTIQQSQEINKYGKMFKEMGEQGVRKFLASPNMTPDGALKVAKLDQKILKQRLFAQIRTLANQIKRIMEQNIDLDLDASNEGDIERLTEVLGQFKSK